MGRPASYQPLPLDEADIVEGRDEGQGPVHDPCDPSTQTILDGDGTLQGWSRSTLGHSLFILLNIVTLGLPYLVLSTLRPKFLLSLTSKPGPLSSAEFLLYTSLVKDEVESQTVIRVQWSPHPGLGGGNGGANGSNFVESKSVSGSWKSNSFSFSRKNSNSRLIHQDSKTQLLDPVGRGGISSSGQRPTHGHRFFVHRHQKWIWAGGGGRGGWIRLNGLGPHTTTSQILEDHNSGVGNREALLGLHGSNWMEVEVKSWFKLLVDEVINPFYIFQLLSVTLWCLDDYIYYASCVLIISALSIGVALVETRRQAEMLQEMATSSEAGAVKVKTPAGGEMEVSSRELVPGDVLLIPGEGCILPCDAVLTGGSCLVNESMLTGESTPVQKSALIATGDVWDEERHRRHTLFGGTQVLQTRYYPGASVTAVVVRTGFNTAKGELIHSILFPKPLGFQFYADALKFVGMLFLLASIGMVYCVFIYLQRGTSWSVTLLRVLDILTIVVPPALPAAMTVGTVYAQGRLKARSIFCTSPPRINFCGKLKLICFDKTGTLTEDGLDLSSVIPVSGSRDCGQSVVDPSGEISATTPSFLDPIEDPKLLGMDSPLLRALASCHSLTHIHGRLVGDPLDLKMFLSTGWELEEPMASGVEETAKFDLLTPTVVKFGRVELGILRELEFTPQLQRMSVVVRNLDLEGAGGGSGGLMLYSKGAPEMIRSLSLPSSIPSDYDTVLDSLTLRGYRVLGLGVRSLLTSIKWHQLQRAKRDTLEKELTFVGFLVMRNSLKPATRGVIQELNAASLRSVMITGDNMLTALSVARECGIVASHQRVLLLTLDEQNRLIATPAASHQKTPQEEVNPLFRGHENTPEEMEMSQSHDNDRGVEDTALMLDLNDGLSDIGEGGDRSWWAPTTKWGYGHSKTDHHHHRYQNFSDYVFVMTGKTWSILEEEGPPRLLDRIVAKGAVYARMSPENKASLVERLQSIGYVVGMCGDGANDCSALKAAHVGISLSEAEASVAAPFTSKVADISCVPQLIREGRCALVTSFGIFKYMALYSLVQFSSVLILYTHKTNLADTQFLWVDLGITTSIAIVMGRTEPHPRLVPERPSASLVSLTNIFSILVQVLLATAVQLGSMELLSRETWFRPLSPDTPDELITLCWETTAIFSVSAFQYLILALVFSKGAPFRKPFYTNGWFVGVWVVLTLVTLLLAAHPFPFLSSFFNLMPLAAESTSFRLTLLALPVSNLLISLALEGNWTQLIVKGVGKRLKKKKVSKSAYKEILGQLEKEPYWPPFTSTNSNVNANANAATHANGNAAIHAPVVT